MTWHFVSTRSLLLPFCCQNLMLKKFIRISIFYSNQWKFRKKIFINLLLKKSRRQDIQTLMTSLGRLFDDFDLLYWIDKERIQKIHETQIQEKFGKRYIKSMAWCSWCSKLENGFIVPLYKCGIGEVYKKKSSRPLPCPGCSCDFFK